MGKIIRCNKVNPSSECNHVIRGATDEEVLQKAAAHAKEHGMQPSPDLLAKVKAHIENE